MGRSFLEVRENPQAKRGRCQELEISAPDADTWGQEECAGHQQHQPHHAPVANPKRQGPWGLCLTEWRTHFASADPATQRFSPSWELLILWTNFSSYPKWPSFPATHSEPVGNGGINRTTQSKRVVRTPGWSVFWSWRGFSPLILSVYFWIPEQGHWSTLWS